MNARIFARGNLPHVAAAVFAVTTMTVVACGGRSDTPTSRRDVDASTEAGSSADGDMLPPGVAYVVGGVNCCEKGIDRACCTPGVACGAYGGAAGDCLRAGASISGKDFCPICCDGMGVIFRMTVVDGKCVSDDTHPEEEWLCAACGDGTCNGSAGENACNCPADCGMP